LLSCTRMFPFVTVRDENAGRPNGL
jgi:hypothetical protein